MSDSSPWSALPHRWIHIQLPGYRELPQHNTYESSQLADLPLIPIRLDDDCEWLRTHGVVQVRGGFNQYERDIQPSFVEELALRAHVQLPKSFRRFMTHPELQSRVRSCTDCYLDPGERIVETIGSIPGHLVHFLSDSQSCSQWYLHILPEGDSAVLASPDLYSLKVENSDWIENPSCRLERIDLSGLEFAYCASSFSEFLYRFWIENEIWFALVDKRKPRSFSALELDYVGHYAANKPCDLQVAWQF